MAEEDATERLDPAEDHLRSAAAVVRLGAPSTSVPSPPSSVPAAAASRPSSLLASGARPPVTLADTALEAMHGEEAARAAGFGRVVAILCGVGLIGQLGYGGQPKLRLAMVAAHVVLGVVAAWVWWRARDPARWSHRVSRVFGLTAACASFVFIHFLGVFSPVTVVVVLGFSFFGLGDDTKIVMPISIGVALFYLASAPAITLGVMPDLGLFVPSDTPRVARLAMLGMVTGTMLLQLWQARLSRRATMEAIARSNEAVRLASRARGRRRGARSRGGARPGGRAPRFEAREPVPVRGPAAEVEDPRLRGLEAPRVDHDRGHGGRHAGVHGARAGAGRQGRRTLRHLRARRRGVPGPDRAPSLHRDRHAAAALPGRVLAAGEATRARGRDPARRRSQPRCASPPRARSTRRCARTPSASCAPHPGQSSPADPPRTDCVRASFQGAAVSSGSA